MYTKIQYEKELTYHLKLIKEKSEELKNIFLDRVIEYKEKAKEFWEANAEDKETLNNIGYIPILPEDESLTYKNALPKPYFLHCSNENKIYFYISGHQIRISNIIPYTDEQARQLRYNWYEKTSISFENGIIITETLSERTVSKNKKTGVTNISESLQADQDEIMRSSEQGITLIHWVAGSGKTNILLHRIDYLIHEKKISPNDIMLLCYNKPLKQYLTHALGEIVFEKMPVIDNIDHWLFSTIKDSNFVYDQKLKQGYSRKTGYSFDFKIKKEIEEELYKINIDDLDDFVLKNKDFFSLNLKLIKVEWNKILICFNDYWTHHLFPFIKEKYKLSYSSDWTYRAKLSWIFMIYTIQKLLLQEYKSPQIFSLGNSFKHILIDEFQDLSSIYLLLAKLFVTEWITLAGDITQSIFLNPYSWDIREKYRPDRMFSLNLTHRSTEESIKFANAFLQKNKNYLKSELSTKKGEKPLIALCKNNGSFIKLLENAMRKYSDSNFAICAPSNKYLQAAGELIKNNEYLAEHIDVHLDKDWDFNKRLHVAPFQSIKWLEFDYVFVKWIDTFLTSGLFWNKENQLYTVLTRARKRVIMPIFEMKTLEQIKDKVGSELYDFVEYQ